jgi:hypothetical protein
MKGRENVCRITVDGTDEYNMLLLQYGFPNSEWIDDIIIWERLTQVPTGFLNKLATSN